MSIAPAPTNPEQQEAWFRSQLDLLAIEFDAIFNVQLREEGLGFELSFIAPEQYHSMIDDRLDLLCKQMNGPD